MPRSPVVAIVTLGLALAPSLARADKDDEPDRSSKPADHSGPSDAAGAPAVPPAERTPTDSHAPQLPPEPVAPAPGFHWEPFGYLRMQYIAVQDDPNVSFVGRDDGFELQNARAGVRGHLNTNVAFVLSIDGAVDQRTQINTPQGKLSVGLRDAYADVRIGGAPSTQLVVRGGFFQSLADPESLVADTSRELVDKPIESRGIRATEGYQTPGLTPGRSLGAALRIDPEVPTTGVRAGFELAVQNGADEFSSNNDNDVPAVSLAGLLRFPHDGWVVAAVRFNPRTIGDLPFRQDEDDYQGTLGLRVVAGPAALAGAIFLQHTTFNTTGGPSQDAFGAHAQIMVRVSNGVPAAVGYRFDILDPSSLIVTDRVMEHTAAAVLGVPSLRMRFQLQLTHVVEQDSRDLSNDRIQLAAEVAL